MPVGQNGGSLKEGPPCQRAVHEAVPDQFDRYDHQGPGDEFEKQRFGNFFNPENPEIDGKRGRQHQKERDKGALHIDLPKPNIGDQLDEFNLLLAEQCSQLNLCLRDITM